VRGCGWRAASGRRWGEGWRLREGAGADGTGGSGGALQGGIHIRSSSPKIKLAGDTRPAGVASGIPGKRARRRTIPATPSASHASGIPGKRARRCSIPATPAASHASGIPGKRARPQARKGRLRAWAASCNDHHRKRASRSFAATSLRNAVMVCANLGMSVWSSASEVAHTTRTRSHGLDRSPLSSLYFS
jgi:hypothetical protein